MQQEERSDRSRAALLEAALALFSSQGYRATSVRDIAERAGMSTGSVYHHFRDKEAIFQTLLDHFWRRHGDSRTSPCCESSRTARFQTTCWPSAPPRRRSSPGGGPTSP